MYKLTDIEIKRAFGFPVEGIVIKDDVIIKESNERIEYHKHAEDEFLQPYRKVAEAAQAKLLKYFRDMGEEELGEKIEDILWKSQGDLVMTTTPTERQRIITSYRNQLISLIMGYKEVHKCTG